MNGIFARSSATVAVVPRPATKGHHTARETSRKTISHPVGPVRIVGDMRVTFPRLPDHERAYALVERDDGAVYRLYGGQAGPRLPHDVMHLVVERELRIRDGIWGGISAGIIFDTMQHVSGRRPPHARERSRELLAAFRQRGLRAEVLAGFVGCVAGLDHPSDTQIMTLAAARLTVLPDADADVEPSAVAAAAQALQVEAARWARLRVGEQLSYDWPRDAIPRGVPGGSSPRGSTARRARTRKPRIVRPYKSRRGHRPG